MCLKQAAQRHNFTSHHFFSVLLRTQFFSHLLFKSGKTPHLCIYWDRNKHTKSGLHDAFPSALQLDTVRWLILPHFPSGPIWDTICLALIMTKPSPISLSLWDIARPVWELESNCPILLEESGIILLLLYRLRHKYDKLIITFFSWTESYCSMKMFLEDTDFVVTTSSLPNDIMCNGKGVAHSDYPSENHRLTEPLSSNLFPAARSCFQETSSDKSTVRSLPRIKWLKEKVKNYCSCWRNRTRRLNMISLYFNIFLILKYHIIVLFNS